MMHRPHVIAVIPHELLLVILERHIASEEVSIAAEERVRSVPLDMQDFGVWKWSHDQTEILEVHRHIVGGLCCVGRNFGKGRDMVGAFRCQRLCAAESSALVIENITRKVYDGGKFPRSCTPGILAMIRSAKVVPDRGMPTTNMALRPDCLCSIRKTFKE